jgi:hypothetical protein
MAAELSGGEMVVSGMHETSVAAVAAQARAMVEARFLVAMRRPRDIDLFRTSILRDCARPGFAEAALYALPRGGKKIEGPSIRFVEAALRAYGNADIASPTLYEDDDKVIVRVSVTDLETNATYATDHTIRKTIERRDSKNREVVAERVNSTGERVFIVRPTDDELMQKVGAIVSRAIRTNGLRILPSDVVEECVAKVRGTLRDRDAKDPDAAKKAVADAFAGLGITPADLAEYLGHPIAQSSPAELAELRTVYASVRDGAASFAELVKAKHGEGGGSAHAAPARDETRVDAKDLEKIATVCAARSVELKDESITGPVVKAEICKLFKVAKVEELVKADLPAFLKFAKSWQPPASGAAVQGEPVE